MTPLQLSILIAALQLADAASTLYFLRHTRLQEANPILRTLFEKFGAAPTLLTLKGGFAAAIWHWHASIPVQTLWFLVVLYVGVVGWNVWHILKAKTSEAQMR